uniref:Uncharacterized protein n=1 Tax=Arundo donax TaxID=35708 RepID=A0A0A9D8S3_ARUDO
MHTTTEKLITDASQYQLQAVNTRMIFRVCDVKTTQTQVTRICNNPNHRPGLINRICNGPRSQTRVCKGPIHKLRFEPRSVIRIRYRRG